MACVAALACGRLIIASFEMWRLRKNVSKVSPKLRCLRGGGGSDFPQLLLLCPPLDFVIATRDPISWYKDGFCVTGRPGALNQETWAVSESPFTSLCSDGRGATSDPSEMLLLAQGAGCRRGPRRAWGLPFSHYPRSPQLGWP